MANIAGSADSPYNNEEDNDGENDVSIPKGYGDPEEDDYYSFLNVARDATTEEITNQYRKLSKIYHPDKHTDPDSKVYADMLFSKTKKAYEVLSDPVRRAIYDTIGVKGIESDGMELVQRYKTPAEIREEYERLVREKEEQQLERKTNPKGSVTVNINAMELFSPYEGTLDNQNDDYYSDAGPYIELSGFHFAQSIETPLTIRDTLVMSGNVSAENGRGKGNINFGLRRNISNRAWAEAEVGGSSNGMDFGLKGYSLIGRRYFTNFSASCHAARDGFRPGLIVAFGNQLDNNSVGTITWRCGVLNGLQTTYARETSVNRFVASLHLGIPHSYAMLSYTQKFNKDSKARGSLKAGTFGAFIEYGVEKRVSQLTTFGATMAVGLPMGVTLRLRVSRSNQVYLFPIQLSDEILPAPIIYGTLLPGVLWLLAKKLFIDPYEEDKKRREKQKFKEAYQTRLAAKKSEAEAAIVLMKETFTRIKLEEDAKGGLLISTARYGRLVVDAASHSGSSGQQRNEEIIDVTVPIQCLVKDSKLILHNSPKSQLPGFYDCAPGEEKTLLIRYVFQHVTHEIVIQDDEPLKIPKQAHRVATI